MLNGSVIRVRFADINAPEVYTVEGKTANNSYTSWFRGGYS